MNRHVSSGAVIYITESNIRKFLIMYRQRSNTWHLPKGTQIENESLEQTALREIKEETSLDVNLEKYLGKLDSVFERDSKVIQKETHYFLAQLVGKKVILTNHDNEHDEIYFYDYETSVSHLENSSPYEKEGGILKMAEQVLRQ